jgi:NOL1/NOP2/fmu family ribosome biogenesis protein
VYSTCTFNREENEENVRWICEELGAELLRIDLKGNQDITVTDFGYRFYPHKTRGEGFFLTVLRKNSMTHSTQKSKRDDKKNIRFVTKSNVSTLSLKDPERWVIVPEDNLLKGYDKNRLNDFIYIKKQLKCMHSGLLLGEQKGKDFIPSTSIALSKKLDRESVEIAEVDYATAILFLRKEAIVLPASSKGYVLISYKGQALGWVKNLGNRTNNLYPQEWRIRMKI